jgi:hypothetical protein
MLQRITFRLTALVLATLLFGSTAKEALGLGCPHHELPPAGAAAAVVPHGQGHGQGHLPDHFQDHQITPSGTPVVAPFDGASADPSSAEAATDAAATLPPDHDTPCTCLGHCCGAPATALASDGAAPLLVATAPGAAPLAPESEVNLPGPAPFTLHLANAPPRAH